MPTLITVRPGLPAPGRDTITPVYDFVLLPYTWEELQAGRSPFPPCTGNATKRIP